MEEGLGLEGVMEVSVEAAGAVEVEGEGGELLSESSAEEVYWEVEVGNLVFLVFLLV